jgi:hypothetical protein
MEAMAKRHASILGTIGTGSLHALQPHGPRPGGKSGHAIPDTAERCLSAPLLDDIGADMNEEALVISRSTTGGPLKT